MLGNQYVHRFLINGDVLIDVRLKFCICARLMSVSDRTQRTDLGSQLPMPNWRLEVARGARIRIHVVAHLPSIESEAAEPSTTPTRNRNSFTLAGAQAALDSSASEVKLLIEILRSSKTAEISSSPPSAST